MTEVIATDEFAAWYGALDEADTEAVYRAVEILQVRGVSLGFPQSSSINGSRFPLRELRIQSRARPLRVVYAFDRQRQAVVILGGNKQGNDRFYEQIVPVAERIWEDYLQTQKG